MRQRLSPGDGMKMIKDILVLGLFTGKASGFSDRLRIGCSGMQGVEQFCLFCFDSKVFVQMGILRAG